MSRIFENKIFYRGSNRMGLIFLKVNFKGYVQNEFKVRGIEYRENDMS